MTARRSESDHLALCMLYWAEGSKGKNTLQIVNADVNLLRVFRRGVAACFGVTDDRFTFRLNVHLGNGMGLTAVERFWLNALDLPRTCLRGHTINDVPFSSSGRRRGKLVHGVGAITVLRSTDITQHIFGAIQEYGGFNEPRWLDG